MRSPDKQIVADINLEENDVACVIYDAKGRLVSCDENFRKLYGYKEKDVAPGTHYTEMDRLDLELGAIHLNDRDPSGKHYIQQKYDYRKNKKKSFIFQLSDLRWIKIADRPLSSGGFVSIQQDITARVRADEEIQRKNELFMTAFHLNANVCTITVLETSEILDVNDTWVDAFGWERSEVIGKTALHLNTWGSPENRSVFMQELNNKGYVKDFETTLLSREGEHREFLASANVVKIDNIECLFFSANDITAQKRSETALQLSEKRFRTIFENAPIGMALFNNSSNNIQFANRRFLEIIGRGKDEIVDLDWMSVTHPDDVQAGMQKMKAFNNNTIPYYNMVKRYIRPDGSIVWAEVSIARIDTGDPDQPIQHLSMIEDITQKREFELALNYSKEQFSDFALASADWYWELDRNGLFTFISSVVKDGTGVNPDDYLGRTLWQVIEGTYEQQESLDQMDYCLKHQKSFRDITYQRIHSQTGKKVWIHASGVPFYDKEGVFMGFRGVSSEVTEQKILEDKLQQSQKMETVGQLTGGIAHDFNNLLAVILGNAELLKENLQRAKAINENQVDAILRAGERGAELTQSMLAFSRKQDLQPQTLELDIHVQTMITLLRRTLGETIDIKVNFEEGLWPCRADPGKVENALLNMAINARDAMPDGGTLTIEIKNAILDEDYANLQSDMEPGKYVMLAVSDTGIGIEPDELQHVFEPFYTTKEIGKGTGLGLSMVYGFAQQSKGHVSIYSQTDHGTTLKLYLPQSPDSVEVIQGRPENLIEKAEGTILVVEDDPDVRSLTVSLLQSFGYKVSEAIDYTSAVAILWNEDNFDLLLTDTILPGKYNGPKLAERGVEIQPGLKVLFMSGYAEEAFSNHKFTPDSAIFLQKPFHKAELAEKVRLAIGSSK